MLSRSTLPTLLIMLACTLLTVLLPLLTASLSASHDPLINVQLQRVRHAEITGADQQGAAHQHEDGSVEEARWCHQHGHSAMDHTHEPIFVPPHHALSLCSGAAPWSAKEPLGWPNVSLAMLERPPKPTPA